MKGGKGCLKINEPAYSLPRASFSPDSCIYRCQYQALWFWGVTVIPPRICPVRDSIVCLEITLPFNASPDTLLELTGTDPSSGQRYRIRLGAPLPLDGTPVYGDELKVVEIVPIER